MLVQPGLAFACLKGLLDDPAASGDTHELPQRHRLGAVAAVEGQLTGVAVAADQQPPGPGVERLVGFGAVRALGGAGVGDPGPVVEALTLGAGTGGQAMPRPP